MFWTIFFATSTAIIFSSLLLFSETFRRLLGSLLFILITTTLIIGMIWFSFYLFKYEKAIFEKLVSILFLITTAKLLHIFISKVSIWHNKNKKKQIITKWVLISLTIISLFIFIFSMFTALDELKGVSFIATIILLAFTYAYLTRE